MPTFRHGRDSKVLVNEFDLSAMFRETSVAQTADTAESTAYGSTVKTYVIGMTDGKISLSGIFSGADPEDVDPVLQSAFGGANGVVFTYGPEGLALGRRIWGCTAHETSYGIRGSVSDLVGVTAELQGTRGVKSGVSLIDLATNVTATGNQTGVNTGYLGDTFGGWGTLHVINNTIATSLVVKIQHCTTLGGTYTDLITFSTLGAAEVGSEAIYLPSGTTINQFVRVSYVCTGAGSANIAVGFMRSTF